VNDLAAVYVAQARDPARGEHWSGPAEMVDRLALAASPRPGDLVIDVGCGLGGPARRLASRTGCRVLGLDLLAPVLSLAASRARPGPGWVGYAAAAAHRLPVRDGAAAQVWALGVAAHLPDLGAFAAEALRALRPGGPLLLTEGFWDGRRPPRFERSAPAPWHPVTAPGLATILRAAGLAGVRIEPWPGGGPTAEVAAEAEDTGGPARGLDRAHADLAADLADGRIVPALVLGWRR
jgi:SAM-dependent methyltransferase